MLNIKETQKGNHYPHMRMAQILKVDHTKHRQGGRVPETPLCHW